MRRYLLIFFILLTIAASGQYDYSARCIEAHMEVSALRFKNAELLLAQESTENPENLVPLMINAYKDFLSILVGESESDFDSLYELRSDQIKMLRSGDEASPWYRYSLARMNLHWAFSRVKFGSYFYAARDIRRAHVLLLNNAEEFPDFLPDKVGMGIMHALIGTIPDNYRWIADIFSMRGSVEEGRAELMYVLDHAATEGYPYLKEEALFFLSFIDLNLQPDRKNAARLLYYYDDQSDSNLMLVFSKARILMQTGGNDEAIDLLVSHPRGGEYYPFYYLEYLAGQCKLNRLDEDADAYFLGFTTNFRGESYVKSSYQRLAWSALLRGDEKAYYDNMRKAEVYGDEFTDGDKLAMKEAEAGTMPNICLLKARLLYDGGYYYAADSILSQDDCNLFTDREKTEFPYRKGRIFHALDNHEAALHWYAKAIQLGDEQPYYFAANAALQSGLIYESSGDLDRAEEFYRQCIRMPNKEYRNSLNQKAKAGLNRIEDKRD